MTHPMNRVSLTALFVLVAGCSSAASENATDSTSAALSAGTALETFDGVTAHVYGGACSDVYATSGTNVHYGPPGVLTDTCGYQCVELAVRFFDFNEGIPASGWHVPAAIDMCASHPSGVVETSNPVVGDLMVYNANDPFYGTGSAGHVAVIRGLNSNGTLNVFNQRWGNESTAFVNGIQRSHAACFLHSVHNGGGGGGGSDPCSGVPSSADGVYCGSSTQSGFKGGSSSTLYTCHGGQVTGTQSCKFGCYVAPAGQADGCYADPCTHVPSADNGVYCGKSTQSGFAGGSGSTLYTCTNGATTSVRSCANGCYVAPAGQADGCN
jgi:hypothetical protein